MIDSDKFFKRMSSKKKWSVDISVWRRHKGGSTKKIELTTKAENFGFYCSVAFNWHCLTKFALIGAIVK